MKFLPTKLITLAKEQNRFCLHADLTWMMENFSPDVYNVFKKLTSGWKQYYVSLFGREFVKWHPLGMINHLPVTL